MHLDTKTGEMPCDETTKKGDNCPVKAYSGGQEGVARPEWTQSWESVSENIPRRLKGKQEEVTLGN
jgi:hypothetical protein